MYTVSVKNVILIWIYVAADFSSWENPFCWILLSSHTAVHNVSSKNAYFYLRGHYHTARTCCCVSIGCVGICLGKKKVSGVVSGDFCEFLPPLRRWVLRPCPNETAIPPSPWGVFVSPTEHVAHSGRGDLPQHPHVSPVSRTIWCNNLLLSSAALC